MKKIGAILMGASLLVNACTLDAFAAANPTCVLMKFTDDTRFEMIESSEVLSDLVMEKMVASGKFNLKETRPIDENMEKMLYDEKIRELSGVQAAIQTGKLSEMFEGPGFNEKKAQSISTASVGQIVTPAITSDIGTKHNAEYLVQGTIINLGTGDWMNADFNKISQVAGMAANAASVATNQALGTLGGMLSGLGMQQKKTAIGVQCDLRLIKAATGEVVWSKRVTGMGEQTKTSVGIGFLKVTSGSDKLTANLYTKAMEKAADKIVETLIADMDAGEFFVE